MATTESPGARSTPEEPSSGPFVMTKIQCVSRSSLGVASVLLLTAVLGCSSSDVARGTVPDASLSLGPEPKIPQAPDVCPVLQTGTVDVLGMPVEMWVGEKQPDKKGPVLFYFHGTGSTSDEISAFMNTTANPIVDEIVAQGGVVASFTSTIKTGDNTGNLIWYTGDYDLADVILACAVQQLNIDTRRIYAAGCSAGGLEVGTMAFMRSSYLAGVIPNSGGYILPPNVKFDDPSHVPAVMTAHGTYDNDFVILHFSVWSMQLDQMMLAAGGAPVDCTHPNGHCMIFSPNVIDPGIVISAQWQFLKDHPFGFTEDPYANGLPSSFPSFCTKVTASGDQ